MSSVLQGVSPLSVDGPPLAVPVSALAPDAPVSIPPQAEVPAPLSSVTSPPPTAPSSPPPQAVPVPQGSSSNAGMVAGIVVGVIAAIILGLGEFGLGFAMVHAFLSYGNLSMLCIDVVHQLARQHASERTYGAANGSLVLLSRREKQLSLLMACCSL